MNIANAYNHNLFNSEVDIDTSMPIISMPVRRDKVNYIFQNLYFPVNYCKIITISIFSITILRGKRIFSLKKLCF